MYIFKKSLPNITILKTFEQIIDGHNEGSAITKKQRIFLEQVFSTPVLRTSEYYAKKLGLKSRNSTNQYKKAIEKRFGMSLKDIHKKYHDHATRLQPEQPTQQVPVRSIKSLLQRARAYAQ